MANRRKWTQKKRAEFLGVLASGSTVMGACDLLCISPSLVYAERERDPEFRAAWDVAIEASTQRMEQEAFRRAVRGTERMVVSAGRVLGTEMQHSDTLLIFMLKARRPEVYRDTINIELHIRQAAIAAGVDPDAAVAEAQAILKEAKATT